MREIADSIDCDREIPKSPFPKPNVQQRKVIKQALTQRFTVVQGPPGIYVEEMFCFMKTYLTNNLKPKQIN